MITPKGRLARTTPLVIWLGGYAATAVGIAAGILMPTVIPFQPGYGTVGMLLTRRRPGNPIGWLLLGMGSVSIAVAAVWTATAGHIVLSPEVQNGLLVAALAVVLVLFPTGRPPSRGWVVPMALVCAAWIGLGLIPAVKLVKGIEVPTGVVVAGASLLWCAAAPITRFRKATGVERLQLRWLGATTAAAIVGILVLAIGLVSGADALGIGGSVAALLMAVGVPAAIFLAIQRHRLYELDRVVARTVSYTLVLTLVALLFAAAVSLPTAVFEGDRTPPWIVAAATLVVAGLFNPVRRRIQLIVDHRFDRQRYDARQVGERFGTEVRDLTDLGAITTGFARVTEEIFRPATLRLWVRPAPR